MVRKNHEPPAIKAVSVPTFSRMVNLSERAGWDAVKLKEVDVVRYKGRVMVPVDAIDAFLNRYRDKAFDAGAFARKALGEG